MQFSWNSLNTHDMSDLDKLFEIEPTVYDTYKSSPVPPTPIPPFEAPSVQSKEPYTAVHLTESEQMAIFLESLGLPPIPELEGQLSAEEITALCNEATNTHCVASEPHFLTDSATDLAFLQEENLTLSSPLSDATPINTPPVPGVEVPIRKKTANLKENEKLILNQNRVRMAIQCIDRNPNLTFTQLVKDLHTAWDRTERQVRGLFAKWHKEQPSNPDILRIINFKETRPRSTNALQKKIEKITSGIDFLKKNPHLTQKEAQEELAGLWGMKVRSARRGYFKVCKENTENETMLTFSRLLSSLPKYK